MNDNAGSAGLDVTARDGWGPEEIAHHEGLWTTSGIGGPALSDFLGLSSPYRVTGKQALELAAALICLDVLSQDIAKATLRLKRKVRNGSEVVEPEEHPLAEMLALEPNPRHTWVEFVGMIIYHLGLVSNSYAYTRRTTAGDLMSLVPVMPGMVSERVNQTTGEVFYDINAATIQEAALLGGGYITAPERDVIHIRQRMIDGFWGHSTLTAGARALSMGRQLDNYERTLYDEDGMVRGVFTRPKDSGTMSDEAFRRLKSQLRILQDRIRTRGEPVLLEDGVTFTPMAMKANEAEIEKVLDNNILMICKLWRMPPHKVMHLGAVKYENLATLEMIYVRDTLLPICRLFEARFARMLLTKKERLSLFFEFDRDEMTIVDQVAEVTRVTKLVERSVITRNEARIDQGYNPVPGGDTYLVPVNMMLVDKDNEVVVSASAEAAANAPDPVEPETNPDDADADDTAKASPRLVISN